MKKQGIVILGLLLCLAALGGGWYLLQDRGEAGTSGAESAAAAEAGGEDTDMTAKEVAGTVKETAGETPVASDAAEEKSAAEEPDVLLDLPESGIARILVTNREGTVSAVPGAGGWTIEGLEGIPVDEAALHTLVTSASRLKSVHEIPDGASRPEEFGLTEEKASAEVEISLNDGSAVSLEVGDPVPGADLPSRYVKKDGRVHIVYATKAGVFLCGQREFADRRVTPAYDSGTDNYVVESVTIAVPG